jgi:hypothetical protein
MLTLSSRRELAQAPARSHLAPILPPVRTAHEPASSPKTCSERGWRVLTATALTAPAAAACGKARRGPSDTAPSAGILRPYPSSDAPHCRSYCLIWQRLDKHLWSGWWLWRRVQDQSRYCGSCPVCCAEGHDRCQRHRYLCDRRSVLVIWVIERAGASAGLCRGASWSGLWSADSPGQPAAIPLPGVARGACRTGCRFRLRRECAHAGRRRQSPAGAGP